MKTAIELVQQEYEEIRGKHARTVEGDVEENGLGELLMGAEALICYSGEGDYSKFPAWWDAAICKRMIQKSEKERAIIAAALLLCEIDRLQYLEENL